MKNYTPTFLLLFIGLIGNAQEIELFSQFNGHYDFTAIGNTMNTFENDADPNTACEIITTSSATLSLQPGQTIVAAYLYWAGSGTGDFNVKLNNNPIDPDRTFSLVDDDREFFAAFTDVTAEVISAGSATYTLSELDLTAVIPPYCPNGINFAGWSIVVVYEDPTLPLNQLSIFDGLVRVSQTHPTLSISLENINIIDNNDAKIGFLAWEGDAGISVQETLKINGNLISNPPLNPSDNAFNGTNSFTGSNILYNMDIDVYDIENTISIGDTSMSIALTSGQDFVMINNIVTVFNSLLPDATPIIDLVKNQCGSRNLEVDYTIANFNCTAPLPANTSISFYADGVLVANGTTQNIIPIGGTETGSISMNIPPSIPDEFQLSIIVDENNAVAEITENNNSASAQIHLLFPEIANALEDLYQCDGSSRDETAVFDLTLNTPNVVGNQNNISVSYHLSASDANLGTAEISVPQNYQNTTNPQEIFVRLEENADPTCYVTDSFFLRVVPVPVAVAPETQVVCDDPANDETAIFDLSELSSQIINNQNNTFLSYHLTEENALAGTNAIENPAEFQNSSNPQTIYIRLESTILESCFSIASFQLKVGEIASTVFLGELQNCDEGFDRAYFDLTSLETQIPISEIVGYYRSEADASSNSNPIIHPTNYQNTTNPQIIYVRIDDLNDNTCYGLGKLELSTENCPPYIPEAFSPNGDGINDSFEISGLYDIFPDFELSIFSRYGNIVYKGNNNIPAWDGTANHGLTGSGNQLPTGTYYYVLNLNDPEYDVFKAWVYLNR